jgi:hypothetical protein
METLNLIVSAYLDFAELQAKTRRSMTMQSWIKKLDDFLRLTEREILSHAGKVSHTQAIAKAEKLKSSLASNHLLTRRTPSRTSSAVV